MTGERLTYRFGPLERRGLLGPLRLGQVATIGTALLLGVELLDRIGGGGGVLAAVLLLACALGLATAPLNGRTLEEWAPVACAFTTRALRGHRRFRSRLPTAGRTVQAAPALQLPSMLGGVELVTLGHQGRVLGALSERHGRLLTPVLACQALSFALLDPEVQERRLAQWGTVLTSAAGAPIRRLQWIERTAPAQGDELARWLHSARDPSIPARGTPVVESYLELIGQSTQVTRDHEILIAIQLDTARLHGRSDARDEHVLEHVGQVVRGLEAAEIRVLGALTTSQLARVLRTGFDPYARAELAALDALGGGTHVLGEHDAGPLAAVEAWDHYRCDGAFHATHWISGWPRIDVSPMFMDALLADSDTVRTVALTFEPVAPERSAREVEAAITRDRADSELRRRFGQSETARQRQAQEAAARREAELAAGHGEVRFSGFVTVSGRDEGELRRACAEIHRHAARARLELRRMYGQQAEAFSFTLPLARGLR
ncbi:MAG: SCO6880 family protein [Solirubrobacteraceae bacterium]